MIITAILIHITELIGTVAFSVKNWISWVLWYWDV